MTLSLSHVGLYVICPNNCLTGHCFVFKIPTHNNQRVSNIVCICFNFLTLSCFSFQTRMDDSQTGESASTKNGALKISLPTVLEPTEQVDISDKSFITSVSKLSLPTNLSTPTSPLRLTSPMSLPSSPSPFRTVQDKSGSSQLLSASTSEQAPNTPLLNSGSATGKYSAEHLN